MCILYNGHNCSNNYAFWISNYALEPKASQQNKEEVKSAPLEKEQPKKIIIEEVSSGRVITEPKYKIITDEKSYKIAIQLGIGGK